jgi:hypothetical protein
VLFGLPHTHVPALLVVFIFPLVHSRFLDCLIDLHLSLRSLRDRKARLEAAAEQAARLASPSLGATPPPQTGLARQGEAAPVESLRTSALSPSVNKPQENRTESGERVFSTPAGRGAERRRTVDEERELLAEQLRLARREMSQAASPGSVGEPGRVTGNRESSQSGGPGLVEAQERESGNREFPWKESLVEWERKEGLGGTGNRMSQEKDVSFKRLSPTPVAIEPVGGFVPLTEGANPGSSDLTGSAEGFKEEVATKAKSGRALPTAAVQEPKESLWEEPGLAPGLTPSADVEALTGKETAGE